MKFRIFLFSLLCLVTTSLWGQDLVVLQKAFQKAAKKASPSVVHIYIEATPKSGYRSSHLRRGTGGRGSGSLSMLSRRTVSGLIVGKDGYILTDASHLVGKPTKIQVTLANGKKYQAKALGRDFRYNLALLKIDAQTPAVAQWGDSSKVVVGQFSIAIGKAYNSKNASISFGIISAINRFGGKALQTDAPISPANTGGALVDLDGKVVGMVVTLSSRVGVNSGIGFAIPSNLIQKSLPLLKQNKVVKPAFLGVSFATAQKGGVTIQRVVKNSAAKRAGFQPGDRILEVNGLLINGSSHLRKLLGNKVAGEKVVIKFTRQGQTITIKVVLGVRPRGI